MSVPYRRAGGEGGRRVLRPQSGHLVWILYITSNEAVMKATDKFKRRVRMWGDKETSGTSEVIPMTEQEKIDSLFEMWHTLRTMEAQGVALLRGAWRQPRFFTVEFEDEMLRLSQSAARLRVMITEGRAFVRGTERVEKWVQASK